MELCWRSNKLQEQATSSATLWQMQHVSACCSCSTMLALTCVSVASGRLPGSQSGHARQLTDPACRCGHLTSQRRDQQTGPGASISQPRQVADLSASEPDRVLPWQSLLRHQDKWLLSGSAHAAVRLMPKVEMQHTVPTKAPSTHLG